MKQRPTAKARRWHWMEGSIKTPGIGIFHDRDLLAHLTHTEARALADRLHDLVDAAETETEQPHV